MAEKLFFDSFLLSLQYKTIYHYHFQKLNKLIFYHSKLNLTLTATMIFQKLHVI